jgi:hypothetical protein
MFAASVSEKFVPLVLLKLAVCNQISKILVQFASVAQLVEQLTLNQLVWGSSPHRGTTFYRFSTGARLPPSYCNPAVVATKPSIE